MLMSEAITEVRAGTLHDADDQTAWNTQLLNVLAGEYRYLRRWLCINFPQLCEATVSSISVTSSATILKSALTTPDAIRVVSRLENTYYIPLAMAPRGAVIQSATGREAGTYQVTYLVGAASSITTSTAIDLPAGLERALIEMGCAWVRQRHRELPFVKYHQDKAKEIMDQYMDLIHVVEGANGNGGLRISAPSIFAWYETPTSIEIRERIV